MNSLLYFLETTPNTDLKKGTTLIEKESVETGSVKLDVYWYYMKVRKLFFSVPFSL